MKERTHEPADARLEIRMPRQLMLEFRKKCAMAGVSMNAAMTACAVAVIDDVVALENARRPKAYLVKRAAA